MLARFERLMEQAVEGSLRRVFPAALQPVQLAKAAARAMEQAQVIGVRGPEVPNQYDLRLAPADVKRFGEYTPELARQVSRYLIDYARERRLQPVGQPRVEVVEDATVRAGSVRAEARFVNLAPAEQREIEAAVDGTRQLRLANLAAARPTGATTPKQTLWLVDSAGLRFALDTQTGIVRIGRASDNDVVIASPRVSRYHAQVRWVESWWLVYDLDSTNGTWVDGERVTGAQPYALKQGTALRIADHELQVRVDNP
jgi:Protein of unknown function (DUF3662)/FHA domain